MLLQRPELALGAHWGEGLCFLLMSGVKRPVRVWGMWGETSARLGVTQGPLRIELAIQDCKSHSESIGIRFLSARHC